MRSTSTQISGISNLTKNIPRMSPDAQAAFLLVSVLVSGALYVVYDIILESGFTWGDAVLCLLYFTPVLCSCLFFAAGCTAAARYADE